MRRACVGAWRFRLERPCSRTIPASRATGASAAPISPASFRKRLPASSSARMCGLTEASFSRTSAWRVSSHATTRRTLALWLPTTRRITKAALDGVGLTSSLTPQFIVFAELDYGMQQRASGSRSANWYGGMLTGRYQATPRAAVVGRVERYADNDQVIVTTGLPDGFRVTGASIGLDDTPQSRVLWRTELRGFQGEKAVFPKRSAGPSKRNAFVVTSLALTF